MAEVNLQNVLWLLPQLLSLAGSSSRCHRRVCVRENRVLAQTLRTFRPVLILVIKLDPELCGMSASTLKRPAAEDPCEPSPDHKKPHHVSFSNELAEVVGTAAVIPPSAAAKDVIKIRLGECYLLPCMQRFAQTPV
jgi:hypothetical protein